MWGDSPRLMEIHSNLPILYYGFKPKPNLPKTLSKDSIDWLEFIMTDFCTDLRAAPTSATIQQVSGTSYELTWEAPAGVDGFVIVYATAAGEAITSVELPADQTSYTSDQPRWDYRIPVLPVQPDQRAANPSRHDRGGSRLKYWHHHTKYTLTCDYNTRWGYKHIIKRHVENNMFL